MSKDFWISFALGVLGSSIVIALLQSGLLG